MTAEAKPDLATLNAAIFYWDTYLLRGNRADLRDAA